ncbi:MAG: mechanosensitive ion channel [Desulfobacterales bacterium]|nr:mechanosensitive ion channel [Desulfobacterales bacterium]
MDTVNTIFSKLNQIWRITLFTSGGNEIQLNQIVLAMLIILIGILIGKRITVLVSRRLEKIEKFDQNTAYFIQRLSYYLVIIIVVLIALPMAGIPSTIFTVMGGAIAIGIGFGAQNLFNNLISSLILMIERPIRRGDIIEVSGQEGRVEEIGNRCVRIRRRDGIDILVPNSYFLEQHVINWTLSDSDVRGKVVVGVNYGSPVKQVTELLLKAANDHAKTHKEPPPVVFFHDFGDNALVFELQFWAHITRPADLRLIQSDLRYQIDDLFRKNNLIIAFPQRDVHVDTTNPLEIRLLGKDNK